MTQTTSAASFELISQQEAALMESILGVPHGYLPDGTIVTKDIALEIQSRGLVCIGKYEPRANQDLHVGLLEFIAAKLHVEVPASAITMCDAIRRMTEHVDGIVLYAGTSFYLYGRGAER